MHGSLGMLLTLLPRRRGPLLTPPASPALAMCPSVAAVQVKKRLQRHKSKAAKNYKGHAKS